MDLRTHAGLAQRTVEAVIRFRFPLLLALLLPWWFIGADWRDTIGALLAQAGRNATVVSDVMGGKIGNPTDWLRFGTGILVLFLIRWRLIGWKAGLSTLWLLLAVIGICFVLDGSAPILPAILSFVAVMLVTFLFFGRNAWLIGAMPFAMALYALASWLPGLLKGSFGMGWQILMAILAADLITQLALIRVHLKAGHAKAGAIVKGAIAVVWGALGTAGILAVIDVVCFFMGMPTLLGGSLWASGFSYLGYLFVVIVLAPILFSLSPFARIQAKMRTLSKS